jgi:hypothetical protein
MSTLGRFHHKFPKEELVQKFYQGLSMASRTTINASARGSIIELTPTEAFILFKKVADNDMWASFGRLLPFQPTWNVKEVLQVEKEDILEGKIDSLMRRLEKMEIEKKEAQDVKASKARSTCEECPQGLSGGSQGARLHVEGRFADLPLRAR